jgi:long-subunit fatty acid transport protein
MRDTAPQRSARMGTRVEWYARARVRQRERRARLLITLALLLWPDATRAHNNGTLFSSPVDGDGAALFWNPAAMAASPTSRFDLVLNFLLPQASYQRFGVDAGQTGRPYPGVSLSSIVPEPHLGLIIDKLWHKRLRIGVDVAVPRLAGAGWPETVNDAGQRVLGPTRYFVTDAQIIYAYLQLGASIALHPTFAIGVSVNILFNHDDIRQHLDLANQGAIRQMLPCAQNPLGCESAALSLPAHVSGWAVSAGASVGLMWQPIPRLRVGAAYLSPVKLDLHATLDVDSSQLESFARQFLPGFGTLALNAQGVAHVLMPQRIHFAIAGDVHPRIELMAMLRWINYRAANDVITAEVTTKGSTLLPDTQKLPAIKNDDWTVAVRVVGRVRERWKLGLGIEYENKIVPDAYVTPSSVDFDTITVTLAAQVRAWRRLYLGLMFGQAFVLPRTITRSAYATDAPDPYNKGDPSGRYTANAERIGVDLAALF